MTRKERFQFVLDYFSTHNPDAETELIYDSPYQLLVAVILFVKRPYTAVVAAALVVAELLVLAPRGFYYDRADPYP